MVLLKRPVLDLVAFFDQGVECSGDVEFGVENDRCGFLVEIGFEFVNLPDAFQLASDRSLTTRSRHVGKADTDRLAFGSFGFDR